jgi:hypothetical protein
MKKFRTIQLVSFIKEKSVSDTKLKRDRASCFEKKSVLLKIFIGKI